MSDKYDFWGNALKPYRETDIYYMKQCPECGEMMGVKKVKSRSEMINLWLCSGCVHSEDVKLSLTDLPSSKLPAR